MISSGECVVEGERNDPPSASIRMTQTSLSRTPFLVRMTCVPSPRSSKVHHLSPLLLLSPSRAPSASPRMTSFLGQRFAPGEILRAPLKRDLDSVGLEKPSRLDEAEMSWARGGGSSVEIWLRRTSLSWRCFSRTYGSALSEPNRQLTRNAL